MNPTDPTQNPQAPVVDPNQQPGAGMPATPAEPTAPAMPGAMPEPTAPAMPTETPAEPGQGGTGTPPVVPPTTA